MSDHTLIDPNTVPQAMPPGWQLMPPGHRPSVGATIALYCPDTEQVLQACVEAYWTDNVTMHVRLNENRRWLALEHSDEDTHAPCTPCTWDGEFVAVVPVETAAFARPQGAVRHRATADCDLPNVLVASNKLAALSTRMTRAEDRLGVLANAIQALPQFAVVEQLVAEVAALRDQVRALTVRKLA